MNSFRHDPDGPENQAATRNCDRYVGALKLEHKLRNTCTHLSEPIKRAELCPGNGYKYTVLAVPFTGTLDAGVLGSTTDGTLIVECFTGRAYLFSPNSVSNFVSVGYVAEKFGLHGDDAHAVAALIAQVLGRDTNSKFAQKPAEVLP